jgi:hypothetical protein
MNRPLQTFHLARRWEFRPRRCTPRSPGQTTTLRLDIGTHADRLTVKIQSYAFLFQYGQRAKVACPEGTKNVPAAGALMFFFDEMRGARVAQSRETGSLR